MTTAIIWDEEISGLVESLDPGTLSERNVQWRKDLAASGPWRLFDRFPSADGTSHRTWQAEHESGGPLVVVCGRCSSSMDVARHFAQTGLIKDWDSVLAVAQTTGRGQRGRTWISPVGNIYGAWIWPAIDTPGGPAGNWRGFLSLLAGYVIAVSLEHLQIPVQIKWPNDLLISNRKCGGILIEDRPEKIIVGIGVNIAHFPDDHQLREDFAVPATALAYEGYGATPLRVWTQMVTTGKSALNTIFNTLTPDEFVKRIRNRMAWMGKRVLVKSGPDQILGGVITGLAPDGGLILRSGGRDEVIYRGSIIADE